MSRIFCRLFLAVSLSLSSAQADRQPTRPLPEFQKLTYEQRLGESVPLDINLTDEYGETKQVGSYFGKKPVVLVFTYFKCPNLCTLVLNGLSDALQKLPLRLGMDYEVLTVSIDPLEKASLALAKKRSYLAKIGIFESSLGQKSEGWHFLTGSDREVRRLANQAGFHYRRDPLSGEYAHPSGIVVLTPGARISRYFFGIQYDPAQLKRALLTAGSGRQGSWAEQVLLFCFHYDPKLSHNGPFIMAGVRVTGAIGALLLVGLLVTLFRTESRRGNAA